jgi:hypothetical protein
VLSSYQAFLGTIMADQRSNVRPSSHNVGRLDAAIRWLTGAVALAHALMGSQGTVLSFGELVGALILTGTAMTRTCPIYSVLGLHTAPESSDEPPQA